MFADSPFVSQRGVAMLAAEAVNALERNFITEEEAIEQAMADDVRDLYRKAMLELAPRLDPAAEVMASRRCR